MNLFDSLIESTKNRTLKWKLIKDSNKIYVCEDNFSIREQEYATAWNDFKIEIFVRLLRKDLRVPLCGLRIKKGEEERVFVQYDSGERNQVIIEALPFYFFISEIQEVIRGENGGTITLEDSLSLALNKKTPFCIER